MHDIDYDEAAYIDYIQDDYTQDESTDNSVIQMKHINFKGKDPSEGTKLNTFGDAFEKLMADNDELLWKSFFQHHFN